MVKCPAQGHKHHGRGRDSNPHSDDSAIRTQIQCTKPLSHGTPCCIFLCFYTLQKVAKSGNFCVNFTLSLKLKCFGRYHFIR